MNRNLMRMFSTRVVVQRRNPHSWMVYVYPAPHPLGILWPYNKVAYFGKAPAWAW